MGLSTHVLQSSFKRQNDPYEVASLPPRVGGGGMTVIMTRTLAVAAEPAGAGRTGTEPAPDWTVSRVWVGARLGVKLGSLLCLEPSTWNWGDQTGCE